MQIDDILLVHPFRSRPSRAIVDLLRPGPLSLYGQLPFRRQSVDEHWRDKGRMESMHVLEHSYRVGLASFSLPPVVLRRSELG